MLDSARAYDLDFLFPARDDTVGPCLKRFGEFARPELDLLLDYADPEAEGAFIDVGANIGAIALPFAKARPSWRVVTLEAHRGLNNVLAANALNNRLFNVEVIHAAAGPKMRFVNFPAPSLDEAGNFGTLSLHRIAGAVEPTRMFRLDDLAPRRSTALVKIDVEGFEPEVLQGCEALLSAGRIIWLAEAAAQFDEATRQVIATFLGHGYRVFWFFAPFVTKAAGAEKPMVGDANLLALPPDAENRWNLPEVTAIDTPRPHEAEAYGYLAARYGY